MERMAEKDAFHEVPFTDGNRRDLIPLKKGLGDEQAGDDDIAALGLKPGTWRRSSGVMAWSRSI